MNDSPGQTRPNSVDDYVWSFEEALLEGPADVSAHLPPRDHPQFRAALREIIRVDLEIAWARSNPRRLDDYLLEFPDLKKDKGFLSDLAFEEFRQRWLHGERPLVEEYQIRYGIDGRNWMSFVKSLSNHNIDLPPAPSKPTGEPRTANQSTVYRSNIEASARELAEQLNRSDPTALSRLLEATSHLPESGQIFAGFELRSELGRGTFGRVFLANQNDLADRPVVLKITAEIDHESQTLARLQHTNIVPIYSRHRQQGLQAVCMPYLGTTTLVDVIRSIGEDGVVPSSGRHFVSTVQDRRTRTLAKEFGEAPTVDNDGHDTPGDEFFQVKVDPSFESMPMALFEKIEGMSYVDSVLWMAGQLASGLAYAHERGVIHMDLKPANILLTDDGQPMLLDFNLAKDARVRCDVAAARVGGTLCYMSPEQIDMFRGHRRTIDGRSDVYSLGMIVYELLTGRSPFNIPSGKLQECLELMAQDRRSTQPQLRHLNSAVTPAVESIIRKCLADDVEQRYQSAGALAEDIDRHLKHLPLLHATEPSLRERTRKWIRRHPALASTSTVVTIGLLLAAGALSAGSWLGAQHQAQIQKLQKQRAHADAIETLTKLQRAAFQQQAQLNLVEKASAKRAAVSAPIALADYEMLDRANWKNQPRFELLDEFDRRRLSNTAIDMLLTSAEAERRLAETSSGTEQSQHLKTALSLSETCERLFPESSNRAAFWKQRFQVMEALNSQPTARQKQLAASAKTISANDLYWEGRELCLKREFAKARPLFEQATQLDPLHFWAWHLLGNCHYELAQLQQAVTCYSVCVSIAPESSKVFYPLFWRSIVFLRQGKLDFAQGDLDRITKSLPELSEDMNGSIEPRVLLLRAQVKERQGDDNAAELLLTEGLRFSQIRGRLFAERSRIRKKRENVKGAQDDMKDALKSTPSDEAEWTHRGLIRADDDKEGALKDFEEALKISPSYFAALQNKASILSEIGRDQESVEVLNKIVESYPGYVKARIGRGVLLARTNSRNAALRDLAESLNRDGSGETLYQAANIYALSSRTNPKDVDHVVPLLAGALWKGFGLDIVEEDPDMAPVINHPEVRRLLDVVRSLQGVPARN